MQTLKRWTLRALWAFCLIFATIVIGRGFESRRLPALEPWHRVALASEVTAGNLPADATLDTYLAREAQVFAELDRELAALGGASDINQPNRFARGSVSDPRRQAFDGNRTFERVPNDIRGGALLIHGLTDAPYSLHGIADRLAAQGVYALSLRMPGHGTAPAGLTSATWEDWMAAVRLGVRHVRQRIGPGRPLFMVGYSNGGALSVKYALESLDDPSLPKADRLVLVSPMIGVSPAARIAWTMSLLSFVPYFEKSNWLDVLPEYLPFKYTSFPVNAAQQTYRLTTALHDGLERAATSGRAAQLPPILTFQSLVDTTVSTTAVVDELYSRIDRDGSELVLFDVNRQSRIQSFFRRGARGTPPTPPKPYRLTVITNAAADTGEVVEKTTAPGTSEAVEQPLGLSWPPNVFSLTHIALPFSPDDPVFGTAAGPDRPAGLHVGSLEPRGERAMLIVPVEQFMRLSYNPFYSYLESRAAAWLMP